MKKLRDSDVSHLRRLLGYVRCEIGQSPEEHIATVRSILPYVGEVDEAGKSRLVESHREMERVPKYVRAAVKALEKAIREEEGEIVETVSETESAKRIGSGKRFRLEGGK